MEQKSFYSEIKVQSSSNLSPLFKLFLLFQLFHSLRWNRQNRWNILPVLPVPKKCSIPFICKEAFHDISRIHGHPTRSAVKGDLFVPRKTTSISQQAVLVAGPRLWNMITSAIRNAQSIDTFKVRLKEHYLNIQKVHE